MGFMARSIPAIGVASEHADTGQSRSQINLGISPSCAFAHRRSDPPSSRTWCRRSPLVAVLGLVGLLPAVIAFVLRISAFEEKRRAEEPPWMAAVAVSIASLALLGGVLSLVALGAGGR